ncbi:hypothetical protein NL676_021222 [Syzygium grande]|nr:hypothetical protein NL676_021222 [Syzygium grande]
MAPPPPPGKGCLDLTTAMFRPGRPSLDHGWGRCSHRLARAAALPDGLTRAPPFLCLLDCPIPPRHSFLY